jgi:hypothetical protein
LEKQNAIDHLNSDKSMLEEKLKGALLKRECSCMGAFEGVVDEELENGDGIGIHRSSSRVPKGLKQRGGKYQHISSQITPILGDASSERIKKVVVAVDAVDDLTMTAGAMLRQNPLIRLMFVLYVLLLHIWVFYMTMFHVHGLNHATSTPGGKNQISRP